eukprot:5009810-Prymnesium_polylepis.1
MWGEARSRSVRGGGGAHGERRVDILEKSATSRFGPRGGMRRKSNKCGGGRWGGTRWRPP